MTTDPHGNLVAYWQQANGIDNNDWAADYDPSPTSGTPAWSQPFELTNNPDAAIEPTLAVDTNGKLEVAYDHQVPLGSTAGGSATDPTISGLTVAGSVMTSSIAPLPEFSFTRAMSFPYQSNAASGTQATADAEIINRGIAGSDVTIQFYNGLPSQGGTLLGSQMVYLSPGQSYDVQHAFMVLPGSHVYAINLVAPNGQEEITTADDTSSATLDGLADLTVSSVSLSRPDASLGRNRQRDRDGQQPEQYRGEHPLRRFADAGEPRSRLRDHRSHRDKNGAEPGLLRPNHGRLPLDGSCFRRATST